MQKQGCLGCLGLLGICALISFVWTFVLATPEEKARWAENDRKAAARRALEARDPLAGNEIRMCMLLQDEVRDRLAAPSTADFESCSHLTSYPITYKGNGIYDGAFYVDAQNAFGAKLRSYWMGAVTVRKDSPDPKNLKFTYTVNSLEETH